MVVISENEAPGVLAEINSVMRRIDLSCKLLAPVLVGALMSFVSPLWCAVMIASWNALSVGFEYWFLHRVYWSIAALQQQKAPSRQTSAGSGKLGIEDRELGPFQEDEVDVAADEKAAARRTPFWGKIFGGWRVYFQQEVVLAGVSLALLYFTVLRYLLLAEAINGK